MLTYGTQSFDQKRRTGFLQMCNANVFILIKLTNLQKISTLQFLFLLFSLFALMYCIL